jgi:hypothetical protein
VKDAVAGMKSDIELLENLNKELLPEHLREQDDEVLIEQDDAVDNNFEERAPSNVEAGWPHIPLPSIMWQPDLIARRPAGLGPPVVERAMIGIVTSSEALLTQRSRKRGERGRDSTPRAKRSAGNVFRTMASIPKYTMVGSPVVLRHASISANEGNDKRNNATTNSATNPSSNEHNATIFFFFFLSLSLLFLLCVATPFALCFVLCFPHGEFWQFSSVPDGWSKKKEEGGFFGGDTPMIEKEGKRGKMRRL